MRILASLLSFFFVTSLSAAILAWLRLRFRQAELLGTDQLIFAKVPRVVESSPAKVYLPIAERVALPPLVGVQTPWGLVLRRELLQGPEIGDEPTIADQTEERMAALQVEDLGVKDLVGVLCGTDDVLPLDW